MYIIILLIYLDYLHLSKILISKFSNNSRELKEILKKLVSTYESFTSNLQYNEEKIYQVAVEKSPDLLQFDSDSQLSNGIKYRIRLTDHTKLSFDINSLKDTPNSPKLGLKNIRILNDKIKKIASAKKSKVRSLSNKKNKYKRNNGQFSYNKTKFRRKGASGKLLFSNSFSAKFNIQTDIKDFSYLKKKNSKSLAKKQSLDSSSDRLKIDFNDNLIKTCY